MSGEHPTRPEDFDLYALGALDDAERKAFESHVASCADCAEKLAAAHHSPEFRKRWPRFGELVEEIDPGLYDVVFVEAA